MTFFHDRTNPGLCISRSYMSMSVVPFSMRALSPHPITEGQLPPPPMLCVCECILENNVVLLTNLNLISHFNPLFLKRIRSFGCGTHTRSMGVGNAEVSWKSCNRKQDQNQFSLVFKSADVLFQGSSPCVCPLVTHLALNDTFKR